MPFGKRRSSTLAWQRQLTLLCRLLRGPAGRAELLAAVIQTHGAENLGTVPARTLEYDLHVLRANWGVALEYDRGSQAYRLDMVPFPLLDLPDADLTALAFLYGAFSPEAPQGPAVRALLDRLVSRLPTERQRQVQHLRTIPDLELAVLDQEAIATDVWTAVEEAVVSRRQLAFAYHSLQWEEGQPAEQHRVEPYSVEFNEGHYYLEGYCQRMRVGEQERAHVGTRRYRLSRIVPGTVEVLPDKLPPGRRSARAYTIRYRLGAAIAGGGVSPRFPETKVTPLPDGSAEVEAQTVDLWRARQVLLRYAENCQVLEPPELVQLMREAILAMAHQYSQER
jgi:predicted DNA-binding transcriptional regulator YafY